LALTSIANALGADAAAADATWLPGSARVVPRTTSASRDTPVLEYAYGPQAQASIGAEPGLLAVTAPGVLFHFGLYAMVGLENANDSAFFPPSKLWRGLVGASLAFDLPVLAGRWLGPGSDLEIGAVVGHESDHASASTQDLDPPSPRTIPYGGGGNFVAVDVAARLPAGPLLFTVRLADRAYFNVFPAIVGARADSDAVAADLHEGLVDAAGADLEARWRAWRWAQPQLAVFAEHLFARDPGVEDGAFFRAMLGVVFPGKVGEFEPFGSFDSGNGKGLIIDRRETRVSIGLRYAPF
jgi:hypothetical protein